eukprot:TRINITY_DN2765_c0_g1_i4.p1 TRINITY_DN2765_c0_g1~~TRINITY_DN2765_c0_g1_i4.p1  ORF type:complete len:144 (+),score=14.60 TRINITY_DN2765_c0_g1_i4:166-597(+)
MQSLFQLMVNRFKHSSIEELTARQVQDVVVELFPEDLQQHALSAGTSAIMKACQIESDTSQEPVEEEAKSIAINIADLVLEAMSNVKSKNGVVSQIAIRKYVLEKSPSLQDTLSINLPAILKELVERGVLVQQKRSYMLSPSK